MASVEILSLDELTRLTRNSAPGNQTNEIYCISDNCDQLWTRLLATAHDSKVSEKHLTAACNAICFHVRTTSARQTEESKFVSTSTTTWRQVFQVARRALIVGKSKPAFQVLDTLATLTGQLPQKQDAVDVVEEAVYEMATIVYTQQPKQSLKEACIVLYFFFRKLSDFLSATKVLDHALEDSFATHHRLCTSANVFSHDLHQLRVGPWLHFVFSLLLAANVAESKSTALKLLSLLCTNNADLQFPDLITITGQAIDIYSAAKISALDEITREVLPAMLISSEKYHDFFAKQIRFSDATISKLEVVLGVLVYGKSRSYVEECDLPNLCNEIASRFMINLRACNDIDGIQLLLSHASPGVRLRVLDLILASTSPNTPLSADTLHRLAKGLPYLCNDTDAFYRGEILSIFRRFLTRLQHSYRILERNQSETSLKSQYAYCTFCLQYWNFFSSEISIHHTYGRNVLALDILRLITDTFWSHAPFSQINLADAGFLSTLFQLSINPYDDIRMLSTLVLQNTINAKGLEIHFSLALTDTLSFVSRLAATTNRADHADALGRLIALSQWVGTVPEQKVQQFENNVCNFTELVAGLVVHIDALDEFAVTSKYPLHGNLLGVKHVLDGLQSRDHSSTSLRLTKQMLLVALKIWKLSRPHLCVDSPEVETDQSEEVEYRGPKDTLAYAWRALRDSSLMMQAMLSAFGHDQGVISEIGNLCFDQLTHLRHRGAFSTVAQTFLICCQKSRASPQAKTQSLTSKWFAAALDELMSQAEKLTRRSAGLPAMFIAVLDPGNSDNFSTSISELINLAAKPTPVSIPMTDKMQLPQVHALNCLKDIMINSRFKTVTEALVVSMIELAAQCMNSHIWAIKNCGLMLFRASINRLDPDMAVGTAQAELSVQSSFYQEMRLIDVAFSLLAKPDLSDTPDGTPSIQKQISVENPSTTEPIFAGLDLMGRLYIQEAEKPKAIHCVSQHMSSNIWHVRTQVARLLVDLIPPSEETAFITNMLDSLSYCTNLNECHCRLLTVQGLLIRLQNNSAQLDYQEKFTDDLANVSDLIWNVSEGSNCALWLNIVDQMINLRSTASPGLEKLTFIHQKRLTDTLHNSFQPHAFSDQALAHALTWTYVNGRNMNLDLIVRHISSDDDLITHVFRQPLPLISFVQFNRYYELVIAILPTIKREEARAAVIEAAVACLGLEYRLDYKLNVEPLVNLITFDQHVTRTVLMSQLSLYTALCRTTWLRDTEVFTKLRRLSSAYCLHLGFAANDQIEDSTRWAALRSLQQWQKVCRLDSMLRTIFDTNDELELLLTVYDLLNDDDEDIRAETARIAVSFCPSRATTYQHTGAVCALASRELLRNWIVAAFPQNEILALECLKRLLDFREAKSSYELNKGLVRHCQGSTVERRIADLAAVANDLFAEEKQNLYKCETEELMAWSKVFKIARCQIPDDLSNALFSWVSEGLQSIQRLLVADEDYKNHFDANNESMNRPHRRSVVSLSQDLEILVSRVITIANILVEIGSMGQATESVQNQLAALRLKCLELQLPSLIVSAFTNFV